MGQLFRYATMAMAAFALAPVVEAQKVVEILKHNQTVTLDVGDAGTTKFILFKKANNEKFAVTWDIGRNPCFGNAFISDKNPKCTFKGNVCKKHEGMPGDHKCHFGFKTADGDPEILVDEGNNPPPPKEERSAIKAASKAAKAAAALDRKP